MTVLFAAAAALILGWFAAGSIWNVRLGSQVLRWMQGGLPLLGARARVRWLGTSVVELAIDEGEAELARATVVVFLEPRDLPWWPLSRRGGRRDTLIVRAVLKRAPAVEFEALDPASWSARDARGRIPAAWRLAGDRLAIHHDGAPALERATALLARAQAAGLAVRRLSVRRAEPQFQIHVALPDPARPAREFFEAVQALAQMAAK